MENNFYLLIISMMLSVSPISHISFTSRPMQDAVCVSRMLLKNGYDKSEQDYYKFINSEIKELRQARLNNDQDNTEEEVGDILFDTIMLADYYGVDPAAALERTNKKISNRVALAKQLAGKPLTEISFPQRITYWNIAKEQLRALNLEA